MKRAVALLGWVVFGLTIGLVASACCAAWIYPRSGDLLIEFATRTGCLAALVVAPISCIITRFA